MINSFTQCLAAPITICFVLPIDIADDKKARLEARLIEASTEISLAGSKPPPGAASPDSA